MSQRFICLVTCSISFLAGCQGQPAAIPDQATRLQDKVQPTKHKKTQAASAEQEYLPRVPEVEIPIDLEVLEHRIESLVRDSKGSKHLGDTLWMASRSTEVRSSAAGQTTIVAGAGWESARRCARCTGRCSE